MKVQKLGSFLKQQRIYFYFFLKLKNHLVMQLKSLDKKVIISDVSYKCLPLM